MVKNMFIKVAQKFLHRPDLSFSEEIPMSCFLRVTWQRIWMLIRGKIKGMFFGYRGRRLYIGKHTSIICAKKMYVGDGVSIQDYVTINALSKEGLVIGDNSSIGAYTTIKVSGSLIEVGKGFKLGKYSALANNCFVGSAGGVEIGNYVAIGQNVRFHSENHGHSDPNKMLCEQGTTHKGIKIGNDCWIGAGAVFLDGAEIGDGSVVGANAVVTKKFEPYSIIAGVPAKVIKKRK